MIKHERDGKPVLQIYALAAMAHHTPKKQKPRWMQSSAKRGITIQIYNLLIQKEKNILTTL